ncbi:MAG: WD40/YVTN/BNR-like repeat-containing protein, partial [Bacteroidota bacterium]
SIAPSAKEKGVIWVSSDDGQVHLTRDGGQTWTSFAGKIPGLPAGAWIPQVSASRHNAGEAFVVANDYRRGDFKTYIFRTTDFGKTWTRLVDESKVNGYALCMIQDPTEPNLIFVGTEHGLWISVDNGVNFSQWKNGYPSVSTYDLAIQEREADLAIATFGRALWILDDIRPLRKLAASTTKTPVKNITVFPAADAVQAQYKPADGFEWSVMGIWDADNRPRGAAVSFFINKPKKADSATTKPITPAIDNATSQVPPMGAGGGGRGAGGGGGRGFGSGRGMGGANRGDSVNVRIFNADRQLIRSLRWNVDTGFNRMYWGMEEKGVRMPGSPKPQPGAQEPGGYQVLPGTYTIVMAYAGQMDSTTIQINDDPRLGNRNEIKLAQRTALDRVRKAGAKLIEGMDRLNEAEEICNKMIAQLKGVEGKPADSLRKTSNAILDEIKKVRENINGKTSDKQGITRSPFEVTVMNQWQTAMQSINAKMMAPGAQEEKLIQNAEEAVRTIIGTINTLFTGKWVEYRKQVEETKVNLFKEYSPIGQ